jgi:hypothetical protein
LEIGTRGGIEDDSCPAGRLRSFADGPVVREVQAQFMTQLSRRKELKRRAEIFRRRIAAVEIFGSGVPRDELDALADMLFSQLVSGASDDALKLGAAGWWRSEFEQVLPDSAWEKILSEVTSFRGDQ